MTEPLLVCPWNFASDPTFLRSREWLVTNGLGGYASSTLLGMSTRRHHGVFIPNLPAPRGRMVLIPRLDEVVHYENGVVQLGGAEFVDGRSEGEAHIFLKEFRREWQTPVWLFETAGHALEKRLLMPYGENTVYIAYTLLRGRSVRLELRPFIAFRRHDARLGDPATEGPFPLTIFHGRYEIRFTENSEPTLKLCLRPQPCGMFVAEEKFSKGVLYRVERRRGYDYETELHSPGYFSAHLEPGQSVTFVASVEPWEILDLEPQQIFQAERQRLEKVLAQAPESAHTRFAAQLVLAADQFIILPGSRPEEQVLARTAGDEVRTVVAGYHWFTDWGRDTMVSLEGLTLCTGRSHEARAILHTFAHYVKDGLLPNLFPEGERAAVYNTVDATLWYFHAVGRYYQATGDQETVQSLYPTLRSIIEHHIKGTQFGIRMDEHDGLITAGVEGYALTWMDAKVGDWVVTPRRGKPVEIQALWYNALRLMAVWAQELGESAEDLRALAKRAQDSFNARFWFESGRYLYDVVDGEDGDDPSLRPNQVFSISLGFPILAEQFWRPVLDIVKEKLFTPVGLRTLAPGHKQYKPAYYGDLRARDAAYHQGTVWPWLIGHFVDACQRVYRDEIQSYTLLKGFEEHLWDAGIGTISEIHDGDPPHAPRGCIAQAWSVAEVLRSLLAAEKNH